MRPCIDWLAVVLLAAISPISFNAWAAITPAVCAGFTYSAALRNDGTVFTWGANVEGQLGNGDTGNRPTPEAVAGIADVIDLAAGPEHSLAVKADGTVWAWGSNWGGQLGNGTKPRDSGDIPTID